MRGISVAALGLLALFGAPAFAAEPAPLEEPKVSIHRENTNSYVGVGVFGSTIDSGPISQHPGGFHVRMGGMLDRHWGAEMRLARGVWHERGQLNPTQKVSLDVDYLAGIYVTSRWDFNVPLIKLPMVDKMFAQAHAGLASVKLSLESENCTPICTTTDSSSERTDISWGVGLGLETRAPKLYPNKIGLSLEYMNYGSKDDTDISAIEAGLQLFF